ncbi:MAG: lamin tail domain-containing protein [Ferruginibacter sp.]|nr:lamin tail domain-containing protein [Ferruginibacter sp.]
MRQIFTILLALFSLSCYSQSTTLVISQFYGAGGNTGAVLNADYVELHNISVAAVSLSGMTIQYSSATNTGAWTGVSPLPVASIPAGGYYLIQMSAAGAVGAALPTPDYVSNPTIAMSGTNGKLALVNGLTALSACPFPSAGVIDLVGYGSSNCFETAATAVLTPTTGGIRNNNGCDETDNNGADFTVATPAPRNSASPVFICTGLPPSPSLTAGTVVDFGSVLILTNSASQSFNISGTNLTGAPGTITINAPSADFQVSNNNTTWLATTTIPYSTATLAATAVWVRFTPQTVGPKSGNVTITGGGVTTAVNVPVSGNGIATAVPTVSISPNNLSFGAVCVNTTAGPNTFDLSGTDLTTANLVVGPFAGYTFSTTSGGTYSASLSLTHPAGAYTQSIFVQFTPTTATTYNGNIPITGGGLATTTNVAVTGSGTAGTATVVTGAASAITQVSATLSGTLPAQGCSPVSAYGFEYSLVSGFVTGTVAASSNLSATNFSAGIAGLLPATTYYYKGFATNAGGTVYGMEMSFITSAPPPASLAATALTAFGTTCALTTVGPNSFDISGVNLTAGDITVGPLNGYTFSGSATGTYNNILVIPQAGGTFGQSVYVKFTPPAIGIFDGNIPVTGGGVAGFSVPVSGSGNNTVATLLTGDATAVSANSATVNGSTTGSGCSQLFSYGFEYSGINGFVDGSGIKVLSTNLAGTDFSVKLTGLVQATTYYYKAYALNNGGTAYGQQNSFTTLPIPDGLIIYATPIIKGQNLHYSLKGLKQGHYSARIHNSVGQLVFQRDIIIQVNFIDDNFILPGNLPIGLYNLEIRNYEFKIQKSFMVQ